MPPGYRPLTFRKMWTGPMPYALVRDQSIADRPLASRATFSHPLDSSQVLIENVYRRGS